MVRRSFPFLVLLSAACINYKSSFYFLGCNCFIYKMEAMVIIDGMVKSVLILKIYALFIAMKLNKRKCYLVVKLCPVECDLTWQEESWGCFLERKKPKPIHRNTYHKVLWTRIYYCRISIFPGIPDGEDIFRFLFCFVFL